MALYHFLISKNIYKLKLFEYKIIFKNTRYSLFLKFLSLSGLFVLLMGFSVLNSGGKAGYSGSPGSFGTCANCHSGGSGTTSISIQSNPTFNNNQYLPNTLYKMQIVVSNPNLNGYGFACEILNSSNANAGTMSNPGAGVQLVNSGQRKNATHNSIKTGSGSATFEFDWTSPDSGEVTIYVGANAVNSNGGTSGDKPTNTSLALSASSPTSKSTVDNKKDFFIYPNPVNNEFFIQSNELIQNLWILDRNGKSYPTTFQNLNGKYKVIINEYLASGVYLVQIKTENQKVYYQKIYVNP